MHNLNSKLVFSLFNLGFLAAGGQVALAQSTSPQLQQPMARPQIDIAGNAIGTFDFGQKNAFGSGGFANGSSQINFSDSALVFGASQSLFHKGVGSFSLGALTLDQANSSGSGLQAMIHQAVLDYQTKMLEGFIGRTNVPSAKLIDFPVLREDDLQQFTSLLNPFADGNNPEEHRYANLIGVNISHNLQDGVTAYAQHYLDSADLNGVNNSSVNSYGVQFKHETPTGLEGLKQLVSYGAGYEYRDIPSNFGGGQSAVYAGAVVNVIPSLTHRLDFRVFGGATFGNNTSTAAVANDVYRSDARFVGASLRLLQSPFGMAKTQFSITGGYRSYPKLNNGQEWGLAFTVAQELGTGFDAVAQIGTVRRSNSLVGAFGSSSNTVFQLGFNFQFGTTFNPQVGTRRSPSNLIHQYIPNN